ncbi:MAG: sulfotransferase [Bacteroidales bacterium]
MPNRKLILVTGAHRSGSTWVGQILSLSKNIRYIHEPFNIDEPRIHPLNYWFEYISENDPKDRQKRIYQFIDEMLDYNIPGIIKDFKMIRGPSDLQRFVVDTFERINKRPLIKDPLAIMSADWIYKKFKASVIITMRHPAAFVASVKVKEWEHPFGHFSKQKELMKVLTPFADKILAYQQAEPDLIDQGILLWNIIYYRVLQYQQKYPGWIFIRHEDLSRNPVDEFRKIFRKLHLRYHQQIVDKIIESTSAKEEEKLKRDSIKNITAWKKRLTKREIERIKVGTSGLWEKLYAEQDW